ncbi:hypothetical protein ACIBMZ_04530 [Micromonospora sp. NPDC049900]
MASFTGHPIRPGGGGFQVGPAAYVERTFRQGTTCWPTANKKGRARRTGR